MDQPLGPHELDAREFQDVDLEWDTNADNYRLAFNDFESDDQDLIQSPYSRQGNLRRSLRNATNAVKSGTNSVIQKVENIVKK